jgi:hypothetical protein
MKRKSNKSRATYVVPRTEFGPAHVITESGRVIEHSAAPAKCEYCGNLEELRPYGPKHERICFDCAMKDEKTTARMFDKQFKQ